MILRLIAALLLLAALVGGVFGWKAYQAGLQAAAGGMQIPPATVAAVTARRRTWRSGLKAVGSLVASKGIFVTNEVAGQVRELVFTSGSEVATAAPLLQLDDSVDQAELRGLIAERRLAEIQYQRLHKLLKDRSISRADHDEAKARLDRAAADVEGKRALIAKKAIHAPFAGLLGIRKVEVGEYLAPGAEIVSLQALDPIYADYSLPERHVGALHPGQQVAITVRAWPERVFTGRITAISPGIDVGTRSVRLRATLDNPDDALRPGMFAEVETLLPPRERVLSLPRTAISFNPYGAFVYVIEGEGGEAGLTVVSRKVTTGAVAVVEGRQRVEVVSGIEAGERVVSAGQNKLRGGQSVVIDATDPLSDPVPESQSAPSTSP